MKKIHYILAFILATVLLLPSCSKDNLGNNDETQRYASIVIAMPESATSHNSRATVIATPEEKIVKSISVFIVSGGAIEQAITFDPTKPIGANYEWDKYSNTLAMKGIKDLDKDRTIYAVFNWNVPAEVTNEQTLNDAISSITAPIANPSESAPLIMSGKVDNNFASSLSAKVQMKRQVLKIDLELTFTDDVKDLFLDIPSVEVVNAPNASYIINRAAIPASSTMLTSAKVAATINTNTKTTVNAILYLYENPQQGITAIDALKATYLIVNIPWAVNVDNLYKIQIKDMNNPANPYATVRNNVYKITGIIMGMGSSTIDRVPSLPVYTTITPWEDGGYDDSIGGAHIKVTTSAITLTGTDAKKMQVLVSNSNKITYKVEKDADAVKLKIVESKVEYPDGNQVMQLTINANEEYMTANPGSNVDTPDFANIIVKWDKFTKNIKVSYKKP
ncbi:MAG: hypothetical protein RR513_03790 [Muribaculaceae bacterium]